MQYSPQASRALDELERALDELELTAPELLLVRIDDLLLGLEKEPGAARFRTRRFQDPPLFVIEVRYAAYDHLILWQLDGDEPVIYYVGPRP